MWSLRHPNGQLIHLLPNTTTTIGRKSCDLILEDTSVSHLHVKIFIKSNDSNNYTDNEYSSKCIISNAGSKKRTKIISDKTIYLLPFTNHELQPNDKIHFSSKNEWVVSYKKISLLICGDCIDQIKNLNKVIESIGGRVYTEWNENCNFYTTICKRVTPKFVIALAAGLPFVTLKYWEDFYASCKARKEFPNPAQYVPGDWNATDELKEVSLHPKITRKKLFKNMEFIFFSNHQINLYGEIIQLAGGRPLMCAKYGFKEKYLLAKNTVIIACDGHQRTTNSCCGFSESDYQNVCRLLAKKKRKMVDEIEIVKAILLCSKEKYCSTDFKKVEQVLKNEPITVSEHESIIILDTPDENPQYTKKCPKKCSPIRMSNIEINQDQIKTSAPVILKLPEAVVKLQRLTPDLISQYKHSNNKSDVNKNSKKRKRKNDSPNITVNQDSAPDILPVEDNYSIATESRGKPNSTKKLKIVNDQVIPKKIILRTTITMKKQKTEPKVPSESLAKNDKTTINLISNFESDNQSNYKEVDSRSNRQPLTISIVDDEGDPTVNNNEEVPQINKEKQPFIKKKTPRESEANERIVSEAHGPNKNKIIPNLPIFKTLNTIPNLEFTSFIDDHKTKAQFRYLKKRKENNNRFIANLRSNKKNVQLNSFLDAENQKQSTQSNNTSKILPFFMNSENDDNEIPNFILQER